MEEKNHRIEGRGRIIKKHPFSKTLLFLDIVYQPNFSHDTYLFGSIVIRHDSLDTQLPKRMIAGDGIAFQGYIQNYTEFSGEGEGLGDKKLRRMRPSIFIDNPIDALQVLELWDLEGDGFFSFEKEILTIKKRKEEEEGKGEGEELNQIETIEFASGYHLEYPIPRLIIQVKHKSSPRIQELLKEKYYPSWLLPIDDNNKDYDNEIIRESSTRYIKSADRLLLLFPPPPHHQAKKEGKDPLDENLITELITNPILSPYIMRIYSGKDSNISLFHTSDAILLIAFEEMVHLIEDYNNQQHGDNEEEKKKSLKKIEKLRFHCYPKNISEKILNHSLSNDYYWSPKDYDFILSIYLIDGIWNLSLAEKEKMFIGDLRDKKKVDLTSSTVDGKVMEKMEKAGNHEEMVEERICRAQAKIEECMRRMNWIYEDSSSNLYHYSLAIDIGASPGGWTSYLSQSIKVDTILSVDKGELALAKPLSEKIIYWQIHGEEAIERFRTIKSSENDSMAVLHEAERLRTNKIDLFCCDANIMPFKSVSFLFKCFDYGLLANEGRFIITLKNIFPRKDEWEDCVQKCLQQLNEFRYFRNIQLMHLLANTPKEVTIIGIFHSP